ncbi:MAG: HAD-IIA family hydrolase [Thermoflexales bacterium]
MALASAIVRHRMIRFNDIRNLIIDMDGVLWRGEKPLPRLPEFFDTLRELRVQFVLATNNASRTGNQYVQRLLRFGAAVNEDEVLTSPQATAAWLVANAPEARIFTIGEPGLSAELTRAGLLVLQPEDAQQATHVVVGIDREMNYGKLVEACLAIRAGAAFVGTNPDVTFPSERGIVPGNGATLAALEVSTGVKPIIVGKPQPEMMLQALARMGSDASNTAVLGDRLDTDILAGRNAGLPTILVLTGVSGRDEAESGPIRPDFIFNDIGEVADALRASRSAIPASALQGKSS